MHLATMQQINNPKHVTLLIHTYSHKTICTNLFRFVIRYFMFVFFALFGQQQKKANYVLHLQVPM